MLAVEFVENLKNDPRATPEAKRGIIDSLLANAPMDENGVIDPDYIAGLISNGVCALFGPTGAFKPAEEVAPIDLLSLIADGAAGIVGKIESNRNPALQIVASVLKRTKFSDVAADYLLKIVQGV